MKNWISYSTLLCFFIFSACANENSESMEKQHNSDTKTETNTESAKPEDTEVWENEPKVVTPGEVGDPPSDAIVLIGDNLDAWVHEEDGRPVEWDIENGVVTVKKGTGNIVTRKKWGDIQLHLEWSAPDTSLRQGPGQGQGNSGLFFQKRYEVQILDSYKNRTYSNGQAASIYKQSIPLANAMRPPGEWNVYDIIYHAPRFDEKGERVKQGSLTVIHNGVLVQDHVLIQGTTEYIGPPKNIAHGDDVLMLQDHGDPVRFRNMWIREL